MLILEPLELGGHNVDVPYCGKCGKSVPAAGQGDNRPTVSPDHKRGGLETSGTPDLSPRVKDFATFRDWR